MSGLRKLYELAPESIQPKIRRGYHEFKYRTGQRQRQSVIDKAVIDRFFEDTTEYNSYRAELQSSPVSGWFDQARERLTDTYGDESIGNPCMGEKYYTLVRSLEPDTIVETGVRHGFSTLYLLAALEMNGSGHLYSVDLPLRADESVSEFRDETFDDNPATTIPAGRDSGWIIPDSVQGRWTLEMGKSQRLLPGILEASEPLDVFIHDSEHSFPCMLFEYEIAWEHLREGGLLISDDTNQNDAFEKFVENRSSEDQSGQLRYGLSYTKK